MALDLNSQMQVEVLPVLTWMLLVVVPEPQQVDL